MTLAAGFKFEHQRAAGVSPVLLLSDSRYSFLNGKPYRDNGKKIWPLGKNVFAAFAGNVLPAQRALEGVKTRLAQCSSGSFDGLKSILKLSFDPIMRPGDPQQPHCILAAMASDGSSKLFYAAPKATQYEVTETTSKVIGLKTLEPILQKKLDQPAARAGAWHPKHFMAHHDFIFRHDDDRRKQAIQDARDISFHIASRFLEVVDDPRVVGANPPLQTLLLTPMRPEHLALYDIGSLTQITRKTANAKEVSAEGDAYSAPIVELNVWHQP